MGVVYIDIQGSGTAMQKYIEKIRMVYDQQQLDEGIETEREKYEDKHAFIKTTL